MWGNLPELDTFLGPLLDWALAGVAVIAAIVLVWNIYESWTNNPDRFSWWGAVFKALGVGLVALIAFNARSIIDFFLNSGGGTP
jgi:multisubunit Na+/H+ antiporter MnhB subunit